jgi:hypothetical protein
MMTATMMATPYNRVDRVDVHLGLGSLLSGYRFTKRLDAHVAVLNSQGRRVVALYKNQWGIRAGGSDPARAHIGSPPAPWNAESKPPSP